MFDAFVITMGLVAVVYLILKTLEELKDDE